MNKVAVFYGSTTGNTESIANELAQKLNADLYDVAEASADKLIEYDNLIFGTSTWGIGDLQDDWEAFIENVKKVELNNKVIAIYGLGDSMSYGDSFVNSIGAIYNTIKEKGCKITGFTPTNGYDFDCSEAEIDGQFVGLPIDQDNQADLTSSRIDNWIEQLKSDFV